MSILVIKLADMVGKQDNTPQLSIFDTPLEKFINLEHELCVLSRQIDWDKVEADFSVYYSDFGRPSLPIRKVVGLLLLKHIYNLSDEAIIDRWIENPYWQYFSGEKVFQTEKPFDPTEFIHFRKRIGEEGAEKLLKISVQLFGKEAQEKEVLIDSTVQEKNITYPTDAKLHKRIIEKVNTIAKLEGIVLRQTYTRTLKQLMIDQRFHSHPKRRKKAKAALRKIKTIAGRQVRDIERQFNPTQKLKYKELLIILNKILTQKKGDKNKIYSIHEPEVNCIAKGKEAKKFEFGNKSGIVLTKTTKIVVGAIAFENNPYDGHTLEDHLKQTEYLTGSIPKVGIVDRGYRGKKNINGIEIISPTVPKKGATQYEKQKARKRFRARAGIEPVIGHMKHDHRMLRNYLKGVNGDKINTILAGTGFNLKKMLNKIKEQVLFDLFRILYLEKYYSLKTINSQRIVLFQV
ncbi:IS5 family transposase [Plebeiibacterium marinum]|uniref:IS5 family transposase n=1 Tax=Plebeiibacterium marinum TaxID=2992111 RepID=A0AAE3MHU2_9BACT|nr:IS5 family transposase [Plebeiobacterium marinum]MCW3808123.1 IS5 family transposase [Plebeiobacterium marinum]